MQVNGALCIYSHGRGPCCWEKSETPFRWRSKISLFGDSILISTFSSLGPGSKRSPLPWRDCPRSWNNKDCPRSWNNKRGWELLKHDMELTCGRVWNVTDGHHSSHAMQFSALCCGYCVSLQHMLGWGVSTVCVCTQWSCVTELGYTLCIRVSWYVIQSTLSSICWWGVSTDVSMHV